MNQPSTLLVHVTAVLAHYPPAGFVGVDRRAVSASRVDMKTLECPVVDRRANLASMSDPAPSEIRGELFSLAC